MERTIFQNEKYTMRMKNVLGYYPEQVAPV